MFMTQQFKLYAINNVDEPRTITLADPELTEEPRTWQIVPPTVSASGTVEVLLTNCGGSLVLVDGKESQDAVRGLLLAGWSC